MQTPKVRINKYDNLKGFAIFLIVFVHVLDVATLNIATFNSVTFIIKFVTIIHLPIFFFVAGYFSKIDPDEPIKAFKRLFVPYILFSLIFIIALNSVGLETQTLFIYTAPGMWFLITLFAMKLILPILNKFKHPLLISIAIALLFGFINIDYRILGITRFFSYLPIYLLGFMYKKHEVDLKNNYEKISNWFNNKFFITIIGMLILIVWIIITNAFSLNIIGLYDPYHTPFEMIERFMVLLLSISAVLYLNKIFTNKKIPLTKIGKNSFSIYIIHLYIYSFMRYNLIIRLLPTNELNYLIFAIITTIVLVVILSRDFITIIMNKIIDVICNIFIKDLNEK